MAGDGEPVIRRIGIWLPSVCNRSANSKPVISETSGWALGWHLEDVAHCIRGGEQNGEKL